MTGPVETPVAELRVTRRAGKSRAGEVFLADELEVAGGRVTAAGRWAKPVGANWRGQLLRGRESYSWPTAEVLQIRYLADAR